MYNAKTTVALTDDHILLRNGLANLINTFGEYEVIFVRIGFGEIHFLREQLTIGDARVKAVVYDKIKNQP